MELERHVLDAARLGWRREDDVVSALIPQYYFEYLRGGTGQPLAGVVRHNQMDLRGLAALFGKINSLLESREDGFGETDSLDLFGLSRFLHRKGEKELAHSACAYALNAGLPGGISAAGDAGIGVDGETARRPGTVLPRLLHELVANPQETVFACEQLAMHYERHARDLARAVEFAQLGLKTLQRQFGSLRDPYASTRHRRMEEKFVCRLERLQHRIRSADAQPRCWPEQRPQAATGIALFELFATSAIPLNLEVQTGWIPQEQLGKLVVEELWPLRRRIICERNWNFGATGCSPLPRRKPAMARCINCWQAWTRRFRVCSKAHSESAKHATTQSRPTGCCAIPCCDFAWIIFRRRNRGRWRRTWCWPRVSRKHCCRRKTGRWMAGTRAIITSRRILSAGIIAT